MIICLIGGSQCGCLLCTYNIMMIVWQPHSFMHAAADVSVHTVTASAERVGVSPPGARVTWSTTAPLEFVASIRVEFRS